MLVLRCQAGDTAAFEQIAGRWQGRLVRHAMRLLRDHDAASEAVLAVDTSDEHGESADVYVQEHDHAAAIAAMRVAIRDLPVEPRTLLSLFYFENLTVSEVAEAMGIPPGTVKSRLFHLRARLRTMMGPATGKATDNDGGTR